MNENFLKVTGNTVKNNLVNLSQLVFEVTDICNLNCKYCGYGELYYGYDPRGRGSLSIEKARNILNYLSELWQENITESIIQPFSLGFYGGEPLLNMNLIKKIIQHLELLRIPNKKFIYNMTTNGVLLDKYMDFLVSNKFNLLISLDGNEKNNIYRVDHNGKNSFKRVSDNIRFLKEKHPDYFAKHVNFNTVIHNLNSVESAYDYIKHNFGKKPNISPLSNSGIKIDKKDEFYEIFQSVQSSIMNSYDRVRLEADLFILAPRIRQLTDFLYSFSGNIFDNYSSLFFDSKKIKGTPTGTCTPFSKKMFITVSGKILPCERVHQNFSLGEISDYTVELDFNQIAKNFNDYVFRFTGQCNTCAYFKSCYQCIFQIDETNSPNKKCISYTDHSVFQKIIGANMDFLDKNPGLYKKILNNVLIRH